MAFVDLYLRGEVSAEEIDDYVDLWHTLDSPVDIHIFLGFTWEEYAEWAVHPSKLDEILSKRKECL